MNKAATLPAFFRICCLVCLSGVFSQRWFAASGPKGGVSISEARWGAFNGWVDVTDRVKANVKNGRFSRQGPN